MKTVELDEEDLLEIQNFKESLLEKKRIDHFSNSIRKILRSKGFLPHNPNISIGTFGESQDYLFYAIRDVVKLPMLSDIVNIDIFTKSVYKNNDGLIESINAYYTIPYYLDKENFEEFLSTFSEKCDKILEKVKKFKSLNI